MFLLSRVDLNSEINWSHKQILSFFFTSMPFLDYSMQISLGGNGPIGVYSGFDTFI